MPAVAAQVKTPVISSPLTPKSDPTLHLPRIICLHGGGTNARIFQMQCRVLKAHLSSFFRFVFVDAPFFSTPGPDVELVYSLWGPFRSWLRPKAGFSLASANEVVVESIDECIAAAVQKDNKGGATGALVGLLGFSQGAKMAASLLMRRQNQQDHWQSQIQEADYRFAVLLAGRAPLLSLEPDSDTLFTDDASDLGLLQLPTLHVHGLRDPGLSMHRDLLHKCCEKGSTRLIEWDGDHRVPIKSKDVAAVVAEILDIARETGVLCH
ncbi:serine hydrolase FSH [Xylogone sp. PMI_703]|nr:serine hydrolase FSH [Xylogone sp. PMI_703]